MKKPGLSTLSALIVLFSVLIFGTPAVSSAYTNIPDKPGQLVDHLYNVSGAPGAKAIAITPDGKEIWATLLLNKKRAVSVYSVETGEKVSDINLNNGGGVEIVFSKDGKKAYVSQMETAKVFEIDTVTKKVLRVFKTGSVWTKVIELSPDGKTLYASNWLGNSISFFNLETGLREKTLKTVTTPRGLYATKDGLYLYVAGFEHGDIQKITLAAGEKKTIFRGGNAMRHIVADEDAGILYISDMGKNIIWKLTMADDKVVKWVSTESHPNTIALSPDKKVLFVSCRGHNNAVSYYKPGPDWGTVQLFDTSTGKLLDVIVGGNQPTALGISKDGSILAFSDFLDARIEVYKVPPYETLLAGNGGRSLIYTKEIVK